MGLMDQVNEAVENEVLDDQTKDTGGTFERVVPPAGKATARLVSYIERGLRDQGEYQGKAKPPCQEVRLVFELSGKKHTREIEVDGEKRTVRNMIGFNIAIKTGDRANFRKLFKKMDYGRGNKHMAQMLGDGFLVDVKHREVEKNGEKIVYANLKDEEGYHISAPSVSSVNDDGEPETKQLKVPEPLASQQLLLWKTPSPEQWDSIFIDGTYTRKEGDVEKEYSKNWIQESMREALDFEESALAVMLAGAGLTLDGGEDEASLPDEDEPGADGDPSGPADDPLADLDLDDEIPF